jgi:hypothetical protein
MPYRSPRLSKDLESAPEETRRPPERPAGGLPRGDVPPTVFNLGRPRFTSALYHQRDRGVAI